MTAIGGDVAWTNPSGGAFNDGLNWAGGAAPGAADNAIFQLDVPGFTVAIDSGLQILNNQLRINSGQVQFSLANDESTPTSYGVTAAADSLIVGESAGDVAQLTLSALNIAGGSSGFYGNDAVIGDQSGAEGALVVGALLNLGGTLIVGNGGSGVLAVNSGGLTTDAIGYPINLPGLVSGSTTIAAQSGSVGTATIGDASSNTYGVWNVNGNAVIAAHSGSSGNLTVDDGQLSVTGDINVGGGAGTLNIDAAGKLNYFSLNELFSVQPFPSTTQFSSSVLRVFSGGTVNLNGGSLSVASLDNEGGAFNFNGGSLAIGGDLDIGAAGDLIQNDLVLNPGDNLLVGGNTNIDGKQLVINAGAQLYSGFSTGTLTTSHGGSVQYQSGILTISNGDLTIGPGAPIGPDLTLNYADHVTVSGTTTLAAGGTLSLLDPTDEFITGSLASSGSINFQAGNFVISSGDLRVAPGEPLGANIDLESQSLTVGGRTTIDPGSSLTIFGGGFTSGSIVNNGKFSFESGTLALTGSNLNIGGDGLLGANLNLDGSRELIVAGQTNIEAGNTLTIDGSFVEVGQLTGAGRLVFPGGELSITNGDLNIGAGELIGKDVALTNQTAYTVVSVSGRTTVKPGGSLTINGASFSTGTFTNLGVVDFQSGTFALTNSDFSIGAGGLLGPDVNVSPGQTLSVSGQTVISPGSTLAISGGQFKTGRLSNGGTLQFNSGMLGLSDSDLTIGPGGLLGGDLVIGSSQFLEISGQTTIAAGSSLTIDQGSFYTGSITGAGSLQFIGGLLGLSNQDLALGPGGLIGPEVTLDNNSALEAPNITVNSGGIVSIIASRVGVSGIFTVSSGAVVNIDDGGSLYANWLAGGGHVNFSYGTLEIWDGAEIGPGQTLGADVTVADGQSLALGLKTIVDSGGVLSITGGSFTTNQLLGSGTVRFTSGSMDIQNGGLTLGDDTLMGPSLTLNPGQTLHASGQTLVEPGASLAIAGGSFSTGTLSGGGAITFTSGSMTIGSGALTIGPTGRLGNTVSLGPTQTLSLGDATILDAGSSLSICGGTFKTTSITGSGTLRFTAGAVSLTNSDLNVGNGGRFGSSLELPSGKSLFVSGQTTIDAGSSIVVDGGNFYTNSISGPGSFVFASGTLGLGNLDVGPSGMFGSDFTLGANQAVQIGGLTVDSGSTLSIQGGELLANSLSIQGTLDLLLSYPFFFNDVPIDLDGNATLAGPLNLSIADSFPSTTGTLYVIMNNNYGSISGEFSNAPQGGILDVDGRMLQIEYDPQNIILTDVGPFVSEPSAIGMMVLGGCRLLSRRRRRQIASVQLTQRPPGPGLRIRRW